MTQRRTKVFFDGGCRPNPGRMEAAVVVRGVTHLFDDLGFGTSHDAEWLALVRAVEVAHSLGLPEVELLGDALEIIRLARTALKVRSAQGRHSMVFLAAAANATATRLSVRWVKREQRSPWRRGICTSWAGLRARDASARGAEAMEWAHAA